MWFFILASIVALGFVVSPVIISRRKASVNDDFDVDRENVNVELFQQNQDEFAELLPGRLSADEEQIFKLESQRQLLADTSDKETANAVNGPRFKPEWLILIALLVPVLSLAYYYLYAGAWQDVRLRQLQDEFFSGETRDLSKLRKALENRVEETPENAQLWSMLGQIYTNEQNLERAVWAYESLLDRNPSAGGDIWGDYTQALYLRAGNQLTPEVQKALKTTLEKDPGNATGLGILGISAFSLGQYQLAIGYWQRLIASVGPQDPNVASIRAGIAEAQRRLGADSDDAAAQLAGAETANASEVAAGPAIKVDVSLGQTVKVEPNHVVFVYLRAHQGPPMPLMIQRLQVSDLPTSLVLNENSAMMTGLSIDQFPKVELVARVSKSGTPAAQTGDWQVISSPFDSNALPEAVSLVIADQVP